MKKKLLAVSVCAIIAVMAIAGSSLAWLQDSTAPVVNTFTKGEVDIDLYETKGGEKVMSNSYKMIPGSELVKDPTVEVLAVSEACWLFVKIEKVNDVDTFLTYGIDDGWTKLEEGVYYRVVEDSNDTQVFHVLAGDKVAVKTDVEMSDMDKLDGNNNPQLKFTAYAVQKDYVNSASEAWTIINTPAQNG